MNLKKKRNTHLIIAIALPILLALMIFATAPNYSDTLSATKEDNIVSYLTGDFPKNEIKSTDKAMVLLNNLSDIYGFNNVYEEFKIEKATENAGGYVLDFNQYYKGVPVYPREIKMSLFSDFSVDSITSNYLKDIIPQNSIKLSVDDALRIAEELGEGESVSSRLLLYTYDTYKTMPTYVYEVISTRDGGIASYIDSQSGEVISEISMTKSATPYESVQKDYYGDSVELTITKNDDGTYALIDGYRNINVKYSKTSGSQNGTTYINDTGIFDDKEKNEQYAISGLINVAEAFDFYTDAANIGVSVSGVNNTVLTNLFGEADARGEKQINLIIYVGTKFDNAFCASLYPTKNFTTLAFGDYRPYSVSLDVVAHEYQHSVNNQHFLPIYLNESGALDEALADLFSFLVEGKTMENADFWNMGEDIPGAKRAMRSATNPTGAYRSHISTKYPSCSRGGNHNNHGCDFGGVHYNSTIITHSFYQMYQYAKTNGITSFNEKNLGIMLYSTIQKLVSNSNWTQFADLICAAPERLDLTLEEKAKLVKCIRYGFNKTGIYNVDIDKSTVRFNLGDFHTGTLPVDITATIGEEFTISSAYNLNHFKGGSFIGWTTDPYNIKREEIYYEGQLYEMPFYDVTLYPVSVLPKWSNFSFTAFEGSGTKESPYLIGDENDLAALGYYMNSGLSPEGAEYQRIENSYFKMTANIDLKNIPWEPIGLYEVLSKKIFFDGANYAIENINLEGREDYQGLFGVLKGEVKNLRINSGKISVEGKAVGAIAGLLCGGSIDNCYNKVDIINVGDNGSAGGLIGKIDANKSFSRIISNCANYGEVWAKYAGGIVGNMIYSHSESQEGVDTTAYIGNCLNGAKVTGQTVGGIASEVTNIVFVNCLNVGEIIGNTATPYVGGIAGSLNSNQQYVDLFSAFLSCKNVGNLVSSAANGKGAIVGYIYSRTNADIRFENNNVKKSGDLKAAGNTVSSEINILEGVSFSDYELYHGDFAFDSESYYLDTSNWSICGGISAAGFLTKWEIADGVLPVPCASQSFWDSYAASGFSGGDGSVTNPYKISSAQELALLLKYVNNSTPQQNVDLYSQKHYIQTADIDMSGKIWTGIGYSNGDKTVSFSGSFNGSGFLIKNLVAAERNINGMLSNAALFSNIGGGNDKTVIKNVRLIDSIFEGDSGAAGIAYRLIGDITISNCVVYGSVTSLEGVSGGIVGIADKSHANSSNIEIIGCLNHANVSSKVAAGILGATDAFDGVRLIIKSSVNKGRITNYELSNQEGDSIAAGIIAKSVGQVELNACINIGDVYSYGNGYASGILGFVANGTDSIVIKGCKQMANVYSLDDANSTSLISVALGEFNQVTVDNCHYIAGANVFGITQLVLTNTYLIEEDGIDSFEFDKYSFYIDFDYFIDSSGSKELFMAMNFDASYVYAWFISEDEVIDMQRIRRGAEAAVPIVADEKNIEGQKLYFSGWSLEQDRIVLAQSYVVNMDTFFWAAYEAEEKARGCSSCSTITANDALIIVIGTILVGATLLCIIGKKSKKRICNID